MSVVWVVIGGECKSETQVFNVFEFLSLRFQETAVSRRFNPQIIEFLYGYLFFQDSQCFVYDLRGVLMYIRYTKSEWAYPFQLEFLEL